MESGRRTFFCGFLVPSEAGVSFCLLVFVLNIGEVKVINNGVNGREGSKFS